MIASLSLILLCAAGAGAAPAAPIGPDAVFVSPADFPAALHAACDAKAAAFGDCFIAWLQSAGASPAALEFARRTGESGYLREIRETGVVDVACADYPFRANENSVCFLVNGRPSMIDVDDPSRLDSRALSANAEYAALAKAYPSVAVFPGRRTASAILARSLPGGGQRFEPEYVLVDGCHACARVGTMRVGFDFAADGDFAGSGPLSVTPLHH